MKSFPVHEIRTAGGTTGLSSAFGLGVSISTMGATPKEKKARVTFSERAPWLSTARRTNTWKLLALGWGEVMSSGVEALNLKVESVLVVRVQTVSEPTGVGGSTAN